MICYLEGRLLRKGDDSVLVLAGGVGYEVLVLPISQQYLHSLRAGKDGDEIRLFISYHHSQHQSRPLLIGFENELEREFFEKLISVEDMGPTAAAKAMTKPVAIIARAIEERDVPMLTRLDGIGKRKAEKIIATLNGKVGKFALMSEEEGAPPSTEEDREAIVREALNALVDQLGYRSVEARKVVEEAMKRNPAISSAEELFEEIFRGQKTG
ncbi:MAG: Holliday junction DNA helicase RuvA [Armatimonadetes bacterium]|nr:Holliday junction DNA helicase RuvA [Armatimonadota bacterium]NIM23421.1 Holliday junction DNA helicase RuvA [Armatimonadota bacterium]NIM67286.1 Holliday junction DNA helicase RuvA [Armatimonadota bacterium]NIM75784.1 Holliday junction DNA helicase RuvA [Armatimonadota bacterium]NIN05472.1 Holliday junction DNA helicase RuvA [Armatimonadota bacterium]